MLRFLSTSSMAFLSCSLISSYFRIPTGLHSPSEFGTVSFFLSAVRA